MTCPVTIYKIWLHITYMFEISSHLTKVSVQNKINIILETEIEQTQVRGMRPTQVAIMGMTSEIENYPENADKTDFWEK